MADLIAGTRKHNSSPGSVASDFASGLAECESAAKAGKGDEITATLPHSEHEHLKSWDKRRRAMFVCLFVCLF